MRIIIDLDGTICSLKKPYESYAQVFPLPGVRDKMVSLREQGHYIIIQTARHMKTTGGNHGQITALVGKITLDWLEKNKIPYDELYFGKPYGDIYIDDHGFRFKNWQEIELDFFNANKLLTVLYTATIDKMGVNSTFDPVKPRIYPEFLTLQPILIQPKKAKLQKKQLTTLRDQAVNGTICCSKKLATLLASTDQDGYIQSFNQKNFKKILAENTLAFYYGRSLELFSALPKSQIKSSATLLDAYNELLKQGGILKLVIQ